MSEFKAGDWVKTQGHVGLMVIYKVTGEKAIVDVISRTGKSIGLSGYKLSCLEHASEAEIKAGHRIDKPSYSRELETLDEPIGSLQELYPEFAKVLHENFLELLGDDAHIENHINPLCKSKDV
ncbi:hypothetical protein GNY86_21730 [Acinetobacter baumannii]|uniref:Uncharacterized protein n=1 Tax=Acinetobacter baumannii TaxID=470 RepID=A0A6I4HSQ7_ACIBA|nr:hypothetical protein [Acinetobacter baumannii]MVM94155.1 hypothetical protein [Acinetobacter baumannii]